MKTAPQAGPFPENERLRSVAAALTPDHDLVAAPFADRHIATTSFSVSISPIAVATISPIVIVTTIVATVTAVRSDTELELSERDVRLERASFTSVSGG